MVLTAGALSCLERFKVLRMLEVTYRPVGSKVQRLAESFHPWLTKKPSHRSGDPSRNTHSSITAAAAGGSPLSISAIPICCFPRTPVLSTTTKEWSILRLPLYMLMPLAHSYGNRHGRRRYMQLISTHAIDKIKHFSCLVGAGAIERCSVPFSPRACNYSTSCGWVNTVHAYGTSMPEPYACLNQVEPRKVFGK